MKKGDIVYVSGDSKELWINDYNCRVSTSATILEEPRKYAKKIFVCLDNIDGDGNVYAFIRKNKIREV